MDNIENENGTVASWWAASSDAGHEQVNLYEVVNGRESLLDVMTVTLEDFPTLEDFKIEVKRLFGGGIYAAVIRGQNGTFGKRPSFAISGRPIREKADEAQPVGQPGGLGELVGLLMKQQEASEARVLSVLEKLTGQPAGDPMDRALDLMVKMQQIQAPARSTLEGLKEFAEFRAIMRDLAGEEAAPKEDGFSDLLKVAMPLLGEVTKQGTELEKIKAAVALKKAQLAAGKPAPAAAPTRAPLPPELLQQMDMLLSVAGVIPAEELAAMVAEQMNEDEAQAVVDAIDGTDWLAQLIEQEPRAKEHAKWLETFAANLLDLLTDEPEQPDAPAETQGAEAAAGEPGHTADAEVHGGPDQAGEPEPKRPRPSRTAGAGDKAKGLPRGSKSRAPVGA